MGDTGRSKMKNAPRRGAKKSRYRFDLNGAAHLFAGFFDLSSNEVAFGKIAEDSFHLTHRNIPHTHRLLVLGGL